MTPEWLWNLSSAVPALLLGWWAWWMAGWLWRRTVWARVGADARSLCGTDEPVPVWGGWRVTVSGARVTWRGGPLGLTTQIRGASGKRRFRGLLDAERLRAELPRS